MSDFSLKYLKYKQKYLKEIKNQVGGDTVFIYFFKLQNIFYTEFNQTFFNSHGRNFFELLVKYLPSTKSEIDEYHKDEQYLIHIATFIKNICKIESFPDYSYEHVFYVKAVLIYFIKIYKQEFLDYNSLLNILHICNKEYNELIIDMLDNYAKQICQILDLFYKEIIKERDLLLEYIKSINKLQISQSDKLHKPREPVLNSAWISEDEKREFPKLISDFNELKKIYYSIVNLTDKMASFPNRPNVGDTISKISTNIYKIELLIMGYDDIFVNNIFCSLVINLLTNIYDQAIDLQLKDLAIYEPCENLAKKCIYIVETYQSVFCLKSEDKHIDSIDLTDSQEKIL